MNIFENDEKSLLIDFHSSILFDKRLYYYDIIGSIAHAKGLYKAKILNKEELEKVEKGLSDLLFDIENGKVEFEVKYEDIHMNIEKLLINKIGDLAKKLHTGRSRNDQVALDIKLYLKKELNDIKHLLLDLEKTIIFIAKNNIYTYMPSFTHLQKAQATTFAHYILSYAEMFKRDIKKILNILEILDESPLGSAALCGSTYDINRNYVADILGFKGISQNTIDAVSDRDHVIDSIYICSLIIMHLSRFCEEIIIFASNEYQYIELSDKFSTGSSIMPQKKNPDAAELIRGKSGRVFGNLMAIFTVLKSLPLAYNKDLQEDKELVFDSIDTIKVCLSVFIPMIETMSINKEKMKESCETGYICATDMADYLVSKGLEFRNAYIVINNIVNYAISKKISLEEIKLEKLQEYSDLIDEDIYNWIKLENMVNRRVTKGSPKDSNVLEHIKDLEIYIYSIN